MTQATYSASKNELQELPEMEKPEPPSNREKYGDHEFEYDRDWFNYNGNLGIYNEHIKSLRTIPCHESCKGLWVDGQRLEEGKDYEVRRVPCPYFDHIDDPVEYSDEAFPLAPVKTKQEILTDLFSNPDELIEELKRHGDLIENAPYGKAVLMVQIFDKEGMKNSDLSALLKKHFIITERE